MTTASPLSAGEMMISLSMVKCWRCFSSSLDRFGTDVTGRRCIMSCLIDSRVFVVFCLLYPVFFKGLDRFSARVMFLSVYNVIYQAL